MLVAAPDRWPHWQIERRDGERSADGSIGPGLAHLALHGSGALEIVRATATATVVSGEPVGAAEIVHPCLGAIAAVVTRWLGDQSFHCGGFVHAGAVWGVLGGRGQGKSTLLADLAGAGAGIVSDDLLVVRDGVAVAGPRCLDLRHDAAGALGMGRAIGVVGGRERWRVALAPVEPETSLGGWVVPRWGDRVAVRAVPPAERLPRLLEHATIVPEPVSPQDLLDLAALPMIELERPRSFEAIADARRVLIDAVAP